GCPRQLALGGSHVRPGSNLGLDRIFRSLAARHHGDGLDRGVLLLHRARPDAQAECESSRWRLWRGMGSAWRGLLSHGEVSRRARADARASDMAQVAKLFDLAFRGSIAHDRLLGWRRALPAGSDEGRTDAVARHPDL